MFQGRLPQLLLQTDEQGETAGDCRLSKSISKVVIYVDFAPEERHSTGLPSEMR